jgi:cysteinyl-tRNA synthetase
VRELCLRLDPAAPEPEALGSYAERFFSALADDFNTPAARAALFDWVAEANRRLDAGETLGVGGLEAMLRCLGIEHLLVGQRMSTDPADGTDQAIPLSVQRGRFAEPDEQVRALLAAREAARAARDFGTADLRRDEIAALGWEVRDTPQGAQLVPRR